MIKSIEWYYIPVSIVNYQFNQIESLTRIKTSTVSVWKAETVIL